MACLQSRYLEDYLAVALHTAHCPWGRIVLRAASGAVVQAASAMERPATDALTGLQHGIANGTVFVDDCGAAGLDGELAALLAAAGMRACAVVAGPLDEAGSGWASLALADSRARGWDEAQRAMLSKLLRAACGHAAALQASRKQAAYAAQLEAAQALAQMGSWVAAARGGDMRLSPQLARMLDLATPDAVLAGPEFLAAVHPEDRERVARAHEAMWRQTVDHIEYRLVGPGGQVRWVRECAGLLDGARATGPLVAAVRDITAEQHNLMVQHALREQTQRAQQQFRAIFESSPTPYLVLTPERYQIVAVSDAYLKATMVTREQIMGRELFDVFPDDPADPQASGVSSLSASLNRVRVSRAPDVMAVQRYPVRQPATQGGGFTVKYWSPVNSPVLDAERQVAFIIHRVEDVTEYVLAHQAGNDHTPMPAGARQEAEIVLRSLELKRLAESLAESEQRFRYISRATNDVVWDWDILSDALWCGESAGQPLGALLSGSATLEDWLGLIHPDDRQRVRTSLRDSVAAREEHWSDEYRFGENGDVIDVLHRCFLLLGEQGGAVRMVGSITDITERKRQESRLREQAELLDYATDAILVRDLNNRVMYWNKAAEQRYGWSASEVIGRPVSETLYAGCPADLFNGSMAVLLRTGDFSGRMIQSARDGRTVVVHAHWILVRHQDGAPRAILSVATDLSGQIALEQRLAQVQKLEALGRLTGGIAHDFNNWLTVIIGNAEELSDELHGRPDLAELASMILMAGQRAAALTYRLLAFARRQSLAPEVLDVRAVLEAARPLLARSLTENIALRLHFAPVRWLVYVDRSQLEASILNLCINARDAMPGGGSLTIDVSNIDLEPEGGASGAAPGPYVVVTVSDTGRGIAPEFLDRVFEPFFTTKQESGGSGLGLSMVYGFAQQSNGDLTISSVPGQGTVVKLFLPRSQRAELAPELDRAAPAASAGLRILLVEDDPDVRQSTQARLRELGYDVTACDSGAEALAVLDTDAPFDLLLTDIIMPSMTGIELADRVAALRPRLRVLLSSGFPFDTLQRQGPGQARYRILDKPYGRRELLEAIEAVLSEPPVHGAGGMLGEHA
jgi:PAS domain S-box-containing protein